MTAEYLRMRVKYIPETGKFYWKEPGKHNHYKKGNVAGHHRRLIGYWVISIDNKEYLAHRLAWLYMTGAWPKGEIDHKNTKRADNRWGNLRDATRTQNLANRPQARKRNLPKGVQLLMRGWHLKKPYRALIQINGKSIALGYFETKEEAASAYNAAAVLHYGEFAYQGN